MSKYSKQIEIDQEKLDREWTRQPILFMEWAEKAVEARRQLDICGEELNVLKADVAEDYASQFDKKPAEDSIKRAVIIDPRVQKKEQDYIHLKYECDLLNSAVRAFEQRKTALENLVKLFGMSYFAEPQADADSKELEDEMIQKRVTEAQLQNTRKHDGK